VPRESDTAREIDVLVVHVDDVIAAVAATAQGRETVLRVTPPFRSRQRARLHVPDERDGADVDDRDIEPLLVPAGAFVTDDAPSFPRAPDTEPAPAESDMYDVDEHFERHVDAVGDWREHVPQHFRDELTVQVGAGDEAPTRTVDVAIRYLGDPAT
jgi:hypothetical protein